MLQYLKRILRDGNHLDKDLINDQFLPIAEGSFELDGQNFAGNAVTSGFIGNEALSLTQYAEHTISTGIVDNASVVGFPSAPLAGAITVPNTGDWEPLSASIDITSGDALVAVIANVQYIRQTFGAGAAYHGPDDGDTPAGLVVGLMQRGVVYPMSSLSDPRMKVPIPLRASTQRGLDGGGGVSTTRLPGPVGPISNPCGAMGPELANVCLVSLIRVAAGTTRIMMTAKRVPMADLGSGLDSTWDSTDYIQITQEQIWAKVIPLMPKTTSTVDGVTVEPFESEDVLSAAEIGVNRISAIRSKYNDITAGMVRRGAFNRFHIQTSAILDSDAVSIGTAGTTFGPIIGIYPGYASATMSTWQRLTDGGGNYVQTKTFNLGTTKCKVKIVAVVHIKEVYTNAGAKKGLYNIACLCIAENNNGTIAPIAASERYVNSYGEIERVTPIEANEEFTMSLIAYRDFTDGTNRTSMQWRVYGSCAAATAGDGRFTWRIGRIDVEVEQVFG